MGCLHLKGAVICPQIDRVGDTCATTLIHLYQSVSKQSRDCEDIGAQGDRPYYFCRLRSGNVELEVGILLPVAEKEGELEEEAVVGIAQGSESMWTRIAVQTTFESLACADQLLPVLEVVRIGFLIATTGS